jgi:hypothetical protein
VSGCSRTYRPLLEHPRATWENSPRILCRRKFFAAQASPALTGTSLPPSKPSSQPPKNTSPVRSLVTVTLILMPMPMLMTMPPLPLTLMIVTEFSFAFVGSVQGLFFSLFMFPPASYVEGGYVPHNLSSIPGVEY